MRISRALALAGLNSRRKCEAYVVNGAITVNGQVVQDLGRQVDPEEDMICYRGKLLEHKSKVYFLLYKPVGYITTADDPHATKTVYDLLPKILTRGSRQQRVSRTRVFPVGRLDKNTSGLLLFTNDGELANQLMHPRYEVGKWYEARLSRAFDIADGRKLLAGILLEDGIAKVKEFRPMTRRIIRILLSEGRKREVRRIFETLGYGVLELSRLAYGTLTLGRLNPGEGRFLTKPEVATLKRLTKRPS